jgi:DnaK suppressor protein
MSAARHRRFTEALKKLRAETLDTGPAKIEPNRQDAATVGVADEDAQALSEMMQSLASSRNRAQAARLADIDHALKKLRDTPDEFGLCEDCEEEIPEKRLQLMPFARLCADCQTKNDPARNVVRRKLTDYR